MMNRHVRIRRLPKIMLALLFGIIASIAAAGMIAWMVHALGVQASWLFALVSLPPGIALGADDESRCTDHCNRSLVAQRGKAGWGSAPLAMRVNQF